MPGRRPLLALPFVVPLCLGFAAGSGSDKIAGPKDEGFPSYVRLQSDAGDYIGGGKSYEYTPANAMLQVSASGGLLSVIVEGDENWRGEFQLPNTLNQLQVGTYANLQRYPFHDASKGGLSWDGEGRGCNTLTGALIISGP